MSHNTTKMGFLLPILALGLSGCILIQGPDLHEVRTSVVAVVGPNDPDAIRFMGDRARSRELHLLIEIWAETDLRNYSVRYDYGMGVSTTFCKQGQMGSKQILHSPYIFDTVGHVDRGGKDGKLENEASSPKRKFSIFIPLRQQDMDGKEFINHDLVENPADICIQIRGGRTFIGSFKSNISIVPRSEILQAVRAFEERRKGKI